MGMLLLIGILICAVLLIFVVLVQNPKGGGLDSSFGAANQLGSVQKTTDVIEKATWYLAGAIAFFTILTVFTMKTGTSIETPKNETDPFYQPTQTQINQLPPANTPAELPPVE